MGRIKTMKIKRITNELMKKHGEVFTEDFVKNKAILEKFISYHSKKIRNIIAGYLTRLVQEKDKPRTYTRKIEENSY